MTEAPKDDQVLARVLAQAFWRQEFIRANPGIEKADLKARLAAGWAEARRDSMRIGFQALRHLRQQGYALQKVDTPLDTPPDEPVDSD